MRYLSWVVMLLLYGVGTVKAEEVSCEEITIKLSVPGFTARCEKNYSKGQHTSQTEILDAVTPGNDQFVYAYKLIGMQGFYFMIPDFKELFRDEFSSLNIKNWQEGRDIEDFETAEFDGTVSGVESICLAFKGRSLRSPGGGGYSRYSFGVTCGGRNAGKEKLYSILDQLKM